MLVHNKQGRAIPVSNADVQHFVARVHSACSIQTERQGFDLIPYPTLVALYAEFWFFVANDSQIAASDTDNALTTIQEVLQPSSKKHPYYLNVLANDNLVVSPRSDAYAVRDRNREGARVFVWALNASLDRWANWDLFKAFYLGYTQPIAEQTDIDLQEILDML